jgi:hypothetical protein
LLGWQVVAQIDKEQCAEACRNHTRFTVLLVMIVVTREVLEVRA